jgi:hypothetical protein
MLNGLRDCMDERTTAIPVTWRETMNHVDGWYFCCVFVTGFSAKNKLKIVYPNLNSVMRPVPLHNLIPASQPSENGLAFLQQMECADGSSPEATQHSSDNQYVPEERTSEPKRFNQQELSDLFRDLSLSKDKAELLASRLIKRNLLESGDRVCHYRIWNNVLKKFFRVDGPMVFCHDNIGLFKGLKKRAQPIRLAAFHRLFAAKSENYPSPQWKFQTDSDCSLCSIKGNLQHGSTTGGSSVQCSVEI